jgi:hypothetical protein
MSKGTPSTEIRPTAGFPYVAFRTPATVVMPPEADIQLRRNNGRYGPRTTFRSAKEQRAYWRCERPNERKRPEQATGSYPDPTGGVYGRRLRMSPFPGELPRQLSQLDDDDYRHRDQNGKHQKR